MPTKLGTLVTAAVLVFGLAAAGCKDDKSASEAPRSEDKPFDRGREAQAKGDYERAIAAYGDLIRQEPDNAQAYYNRSLAHLAKGDYGRAIADLTEVIRLAPQDVAAHNNLAWLRATCPDARLRDAKQAVQCGTKACALTNWKAAGCLDTLAAAYAQAGDFERARQVQAKAIELLADEKAKTELRARLELYEQDQPYREKPKRKAEQEAKTEETE